MVNEPRGSDACKAYGEPISTGDVQLAGKRTEGSSVFRSDYLHLRTLSKSIRSIVDLDLHGKSGLRVLDVGCGRKPYFPVFHSISSFYLGVDIEQVSAQPDCIAQGESQPFANHSFDVVIATQMLGYVNSPRQVLGEFRRILRVGGLVLASTHGFFPYVGDRWRFTDDGLMVLFRSANFQDIKVTPNGGAAVSLLQAALLLADAATGYRHIPISKFVMAPFFGCANLTGLALHELLGNRGGKFLSQNYTVSARKGLTSDLP